jgi:hypothetical protein
LVEVITQNRGEGNKTAIMFFNLKAIASICFAINVVVEAQHVHGAAHRKSAFDNRGAVASESKVCSTIGTAILNEGGNAADALVATVFCIGVIGMYHSGYDA